MHLDYCVVLDCLQVEQDGVAVIEKFTTNKEEVCKNIGKFHSPEETTKSKLMLALQAGASGLPGCALSASASSTTLLI